MAASRRRLAAKRPPDSPDQVAWSLLQTGVASIVSGGNRGHLFLHDQDGALVGKRQLTEGWVNGLAAVSPECREIVAGTSRGELVRLDASTLRPARSVQVGRWINGLASIPGAAVAATADGHLLRWDHKSGSTTSLGVFQGQAWDCAFAPTAAVIAVGGDGGRLQIWDSNRFQLRAVKSSNAFAITSVAVHDASSTLASLDLGGVLTLWSLPQGDLLGAVAAHAGRAWGVSISGDGRLVATGGADRRVVVWRTSNLSHLRTFEVDAAVTAVTFDDTGRWVFAATRDRKLRRLGPVEPHPSEPGWNNGLTLFIAGGEPTAAARDLLDALGRSGLDYQSVSCAQVVGASEWLAKRSGGGALPQLLLHGRALGGREVAVEMVRSGVIERLLSEPW